MIKQYWADIALIVILILLPCLFFWRLVTPNLSDQQQIKSGDFTEQYFPLRAFTAREWVQGRVPLWNPHLFGGQPGLADIQAGGLYPPHIIQAIILGWIAPFVVNDEIGFPLQALEWQIIFHFVVAAIGCYLFARQVFVGTHSFRFTCSLRHCRFGAVVVAIVFTYSGYLTSFPVQQLTILAVSSWLPWILWACYKAVCEASLRWVGGGGLLFSLALLAGHPQTMLYLVYLSLAYTMFVSWQQFSRFQDSVSIQNDEDPIYFNKFAQVTKTVATTWLPMLILGCGIALPQLWSTAELISHSLRANLSYDDVSAGLPLNEAIAILYPGFFGGSAQYVGWAPLVLIIVVWVLHGQRPIIIFWSVIAGISLILAFGKNSFLYSLFYLFVPGFEAVRQQNRAFLLFSFSLAMLAGYGAIILTSPMKHTIRVRYSRFLVRFQHVTLIALIGTVLLIYGSTQATALNQEVNLFYGLLWHHLLGLIMLGGMGILLLFRQQRWLRQTWGMMLLASWLIFNLFTINWQYNLEEPNRPFKQTDSVQFLQYQAHQQRISSAGFLSGGHSAAAVYGLQDLTGNTPLQLARMHQFMETMQSWRMWQLLNVRYIIDSRDLSSKGLALQFSEENLKIYEILDPFPRAWFVEMVEVISDDSLAINRLSEDAFNLRRQAVVDTALPISLEKHTATIHQIEQVNSTYLQLNVSAEGSSLLILSQTYYPGWQAYLNNQPVPLYRVNVVQQGVIIPAGYHEVELRFEPSSFWWGSIGTIVALLICVGLIINLNIITIFSKSNETDKTTN